MKIFMLLAIAFSLNTFAVELGEEFLSVRSEKSVDFYWSSNRSYYACSYAEGQARKTLRALGAQDISTKCSGGIEPGHTFWTPLDMTVNFSVNESDENGVEPVTRQKVVLRGNQSCDFNVKLIDTLLGQVEHTLISKKASCFDSQGSYKYEIEVTK